MGGILMDYVRPNGVIQTIAVAGQKKANLSILHILIKGFL